METLHLKIDKSFFLCGEEETSSEPQFCLLYLWHLMLQDEWWIPDKGVLFDVKVPLSRVPVLMEQKNGQQGHEYQFEISMWNPHDHHHRDLGKFYFTLIVIPSSSSHHFRPCLLLRLSNPHNSARTLEWSVFPPLEQDDAVEFPLWCSKTQHFMSCPFLRPSSQIFDLSQTNDLSSSWCLRDFIEKDSLLAVIITSSFVGVDPICLLFNSSLENAHSHCWIFVNLTNLTTLQADMTSVTDFTDFDESFYILSQRKNLKSLESLSVIFFWMNMRLGYGLICDQNRAIKKRFVVHLTNENEIKKK